MNLLPQPWIQGVADYGAMRDRFLLVQVTMERRHLHWRDVGKGWEWIDRVSACWQALKSSHVSAGAVGPPAAVNLA